MVSATIAVAEPVFKAGGSQKAEMQVSSDHRVLRLRAKLVDCVRTIQPGWQDETASNTTSETEQFIPITNQPWETDEDRESTRATNVKMTQQFNWFNSCVGVASRGHTSPDGPCGMTKKRFDEFWRTLIIESIPVRPRGTDDEKAKDGFLHYATLAKERGIAVLRDVYVVENGSFQNPQPDTRRVGVFDTENSLKYVMTVANFGISRKDRLVLVPRMADPGDEIWVIQGAQVPYVFRRLSDARRQLIGECYVSGMMDGEAMDMDDIPLERIEVQ